MTVLMMTYGPVLQQPEPKVDWVDQGRIVQEYIGNWSKNPRSNNIDENDDKRLRNFLRRACKREAEKPL